ncbi:MAG: hypothetical protein ACR2K0_07605, partial [Acidimicrobiales bacterium]
MLATLAACFAVATAWSAAAPVGAQEGDGARPFVNVVQVTGYLDPIMADFLERAIAESERAGAEALILQLDSPGSVLPPAELDALVFRIGHARVPIAAWVGEGGAQALGGAAQLALAAPLAGLA